MIALNSYSEDVVADEIIRRLRDEARKPGEFVKVHACVPSSDIPDERETRLVILGPEYPHTAKDDNSKARKEAANILDCRGSSPRNYRNTLLFLAADSNRLKELDEAVRKYIAWNSISEERETLNLDAFQIKLTETRLTNTDETVDARIPETFQWLIVPGQSDPKGDIEWTEIRLHGQDHLATRASKKLKNDELLKVELGDVPLRHELDRVPLWRGDHVGIKQLIEDVAKYLYLPRLRDQDVLLDAIRQGVARLTWQSETFAYAEGWDEQKKRYKGLAVGPSVRVLVDAGSLLVKPDVAVAQMEADELAKKKKGDGKDVGDGDGKTKLDDEKKKDGKKKDDDEKKKKPRPHRFFGSVKLDAIRLSRDADKVAQEIVQHLTALVGTEVDVTLEVHAKIPDGASPELERTITENCRTLKFENYGFEET